MALGYAQGSVGSRTLATSGRPWKVLFVDEGNILSALAVNNRDSVGQVVYSQVADITAGIEFGLLFESADLAGLKDVVADIRTAMLAGDSFNVNVANDWVSVNTNCIASGSDWLSWPTSQRTHAETIEKVTIKLKTV